MHLLTATVHPVAAAGILGFSFLVMIVFGLFTYFVPTIIAFSRKKGNKVAILALNFFLGWSLIGWVVSLVWALAQEQQPVVIHNSNTGVAGS